MSENKNKTEYLHKLISFFQKISLMQTMKIKINIFRNVFLLLNKRMISHDSAIKQYLKYKIEKINLENAIDKSF